MLNDALPRSCCSHLLGSMPPILTTEGATLVRSSPPNAPSSTSSSSNTFFNFRLAFPKRPAIDQETKYHFRDVGDFCCMSGIPLMPGVHYRSCCSVSHICTKFPSCGCAIGSALILRHRLVIIHCTTKVVTSRVHITTTLTLFSRSACTCDPNVLVWLKSDTHLTEFSTHCQA